MDMSNKSLALLLVAAIVISLGGTMLSLSKLSQIGITAPGRITGMVPGNVSLTISENTSCNVDTNVTFGSAGQPAGTTTLETDKDNSPWNNCSSAGNSTCGGIQINNTGNTILNVTFTSTKDGADFLGAGASASDFMYKIDDAEVEDNACTTNGSGHYVNVIKTPTTAVVCTGLNFSDVTDTVLIDFNVTIDQNTVPESKTAALTITCVKKPGT